VELRRAVAPFTRKPCNTRIAFMKNITIALDEEVARWARVWAAQHNSSVSRMLGEMLAQRMRAEATYEAAMKRFLSKKPVLLRKSTDQKLPTREALYDRDVLR